ncbi:MAG: glycosyltransferase [Reichenbachiella sp.]|uniref:glycosyltransferase n=1 Tax=Reichenbachiella sp. TaxID=2184521 RepID=UPI00296763C8|nr:glycosyltransferase [Reichenbachiella sp.]MDW3208240.1 glycosyltransferase [Reichenbachiella sp.]
MGNQIVICLSNESYDAKIWTNKQHLMSRLSKHPNYDIMYIDQGMSSRYIRQAITEKNWKYFLRPLKKMGEGLTIFSPYFLPLIKGGRVKRWSWLLLFWFIKFYIKKIEYTKIIFWTYQPQAWYLIKHVKKVPGTTILYDCVDEFATQPFYKNNENRTKELLQIEALLTKKSDIVTTTSKALCHDKIEINPNTHYIHNVGDFNHFKQPNGELSSEEHLWLADDRVKVLYAGVIDDYKTDLDLIYSIAKELKDSHLFVFIGPIRISDEKIFKKIDGQNNTLFIGTKPYLEIPNFLHNADLLWLPYSISTHTNRVFPLKLFEYLSTGKFILSRNLTSIEEYGKYISTFETIEQAVLHLKQWPMSDSIIKKEQRIQLASKNTWESRLENILKCIP